MNHHCAVKRKNTSQKFGYVFSPGSRFPWQKKLPRRFKTKKFFNGDGAFAPTAIRSLLLLSLYSVLVVLSWEQIIWLCFVLVKIGHHRPLRKGFCACFCRVNSRGREICHENSGTFSTRFYRARVQNAPQKLKARDSAVSGKKGVGLSNVCLLVGSGFFLPYPLSTLHKCFMHVVERVGKLCCVVDIVAGGGAFFKFARLFPYLLYAHIRRNNYSNA